MLGSNETRVGQLLHQTCPDPMLKRDRGRCCGAQSGGPSSPFSVGFQCRFSPDNFHTTTLQRAKKSSSAVTGPSALALAPTRLWPSDCWCWAHSRKSRNLQPREDEPREGVVEGRSRSDASHLFQFPISAFPSTSHDAIHRRTEERHHLRTSTEPPTTAARGRPQHVPRYEHLFGVQISR